MVSPARISGTKIWIKRSAGANNNDDDTKNLKRKGARNVLARIVWVLLLLLSAAGGYGLASSVVWQDVAESLGMASPIWPWIGMGIGIIIAFLLWPPLEKRWERIAKGFIVAVQKTPIHDILAGAVGLLVGLLIAILLTLRMPRDIPLIGEYLPVLVTLVIG